MEPSQQAKEKERPLRSHRRILAVCVLTATVTALSSTAAGASASAARLVKDVLSPADAHALGYTKVLEQAKTPAKTGEKNCPEGAEQVFEDAAGQTGLASEVLACTGSKAAAALLSQIRSQSVAVALKPPKGLGPSAIERNLGRYTFAIYWRKGAMVDAVALTTNLIAATSSTTTTSTVPSTLTSTQQSNLSKAALTQNSLHG